MVKEMDRQPAISGPYLLKQLTVLDTIYWISNSWKEVENAMIQKCFLNEGFNVEHNEQDGEREEVIDDEGDDDDDDNILLATLRLSYDLFGCSLKV